MRLFRALIPLLVTVIIILLLHRPPPTVPALGRLLDPVSGWAANAEPVSDAGGRELKLQGLNKDVTVWMEDRLVPHLHAGSEHDMYFTQGYIHAFFRLWQMDFQTRAAAGRISEVVGEKWVKDEKTGRQKNAVLEFDRMQRRKGMVFAAENSLEAMEADPRTKKMLDAYTVGVNSFIAGLKYRDYPLEYKLMGFAPELWTNLKSALLLKYMADDLTGYTEDIALTLLRDRLPAAELELLFPQRIPGSVPVIPQGTKFDLVSLPPPPVPEGEVWSRLQPALAAGVRNPAPLSLPFEEDRREPGGIGSNSWAVSGARTASGAPILCNDPHLGLNLPSLWFEMQLQAPGVNVYGVSLPGAPGIVIGFNDSLSWGFTNNYRDVKDFYEIEAIDRDFYRFDGRPQPFDKRVELIRIRGQEDYADTVSYTVHGPITYDASFPDPSGSGKSLAMCWMAHRSTNELLSLYLLNRARGYVEFTEAILNFQCPAQNMVYADRAGNIAMWGQGQFINKFRDQGRYVMKGNTSATLWGAEIPMTENPHVLNPKQGYLASANQVTTDSTYPYWYNGYFYDFRAWRTNELLAAGRVRTAADHMKMQQDLVSVLARNVAAFFGRSLRDTAGTAKDPPWNFALDPDSRVATRFQLAWTIFLDQLWKQQFSTPYIYPSPERTMQLLMGQGSRPRYDSLIKAALHNTEKLLEDSLARIENGGSEWWKVKGTQLTHLAKLDAFSYKNLHTGGWGNTINALKKTHGPSWRMVVEMAKDSIRAYGVYPGGQSGNPGSRYYGTFVQQWVSGSYYRISFLPNQQEQQSKDIKQTWTIRALQ